MTAISTQARGLGVRQLLWIAALLVLLGTLGWLGRTLLGAQQAALQLLPTQVPCDLRRGPCSAGDGQRQILFAIDSAAIESSHPLNLRVELQGFTADAVAIELQGRDMFMGQNRFLLEAQDDGSYRAQGRLPVCTTDLMVWRATVRISEGQRQLGGLFDFEAR